MHELNIMTSDGWVVTRQADRPIDLGGAILSSIIVQPKEDHDKRIAENPDTPRREYRLEPTPRHATPEGIDLCGISVAPEGWWCSREMGHDGPCAARRIGEDNGLEVGDAR